MSKYSPKMVEAVGQLAAKGATNKQIIQAVGVSTKTFYEWLKNEPEFAETINQNRKVVAQEVVPKLVKRAKGYAYTEKTVEYGYKDGERVKLSEKTVRKQLPPDVAAAKYILNNWDPENWSDKQSLEHQIPDGYGVIVLPGQKSIADWEAEAQSLDSEDGS